jgi:hypothetical protein
LSYSKPPWDHELDGTRAILADVANEGEDVSWRYLKPARPAIEDLRVIRKEAPKERLDEFMGVLTGSERHGQRQGISVIGIVPRLPADKTQSPAFSLANLTNDPATKESEEFVGQLRPFRAAATIASSVEFGGALARWGNA